MRLRSPKNNLIRQKTLYFKRESAVLSYPTLDYLPKLNLEEMERSKNIVFETYEPSSEWAQTPWDNQAVSYTSKPYAILDSTFQWEGEAGATYDFFSSSFFNPYLIRVYDQHGSVVAVSGSDYSGIYGQKSIFDYVAPYSGTYYASAGWNQGNAESHRFVMFSIYEDVDTIPTPLPPTSSTEDEKLDLAQDQINKLTELYTGFFGRAAEYNGLEYHKQTLGELLERGLTEDQAFVNIANQFWVAGKQYGQETGFSDYMSDIDFITTVYANVLGRPDAEETDIEGINHWVNDMKQSGSSHGEMVLKILEGAHHYIELNPTDQVSNYVESLLNNRTEISLFFAQENISGDLFGEQAIQAGKDVLQRIDQNVTSVNNVKHALLNNTLFELPEIELVGVGQADALVDSMGM